jgi:lysine 2,3-aminomutase
MSSRTLNSPQALHRAGLVSDPEALAPVAARYAIALTPHLASLIDAGDPDDPIARQFIPSVQELTTTPQERADPIGDHAHEPLPGLIHRYPDRVLLKVTGVCPVYCRFCFRREMVGPGSDGAIPKEGLEAALDYVRARPAIREVILTGGDPLMLSAERAGALTQALGAIPHLDILRWHTRMPVAAPQRITEGYAQALGATEKAVFLVVHANHAREITPEVVAALRRLNAAGVVLRSQSVLLAGVNDSVEALEALMRALVAARVSPYYLHHPDLAPGTGHFRLSVERGQALVQTLRDRVSGLCQPDYVLDIPGGVSKARLSPCDATQTPDGRVSLRGRDGRERAYEG